MRKEIFLILFICLTALLPPLYQTTFASYLTDDIEKPQVVLQTGHSQSVSQVVFDGEGRFLASASKDNTVKIWEVETGRELRSFAGHTAPVKALALSKNGLWLASGGNDQTIRIHNIADGREIQLINEQSGSIEALAFSPDGKMLASGGTDAIINIWNTANGERLYKLEGHLGWITALIFSPDSRQIASGSADNTVKVWEVGEKNKYRTVENHKDRITALSFNADGTFLASGAADGKIEVSSLNAKKKSFALKGHKAKILALGFLPDNQLVSADGNKIIKTWSIIEEHEISSVGSSSDESESAAFNSNAELIAFGKGNRTIEIVKTADKEKLSSLESRTTGFYGTAFSDNGHWLAAGGNDNTIKLFDLQTGQSLPPLTGHGGYVTCLKFSPDSQFLISSGIDRSIRIWDVAAGKTIRTLNGHQGTVNSLDISSDGKLLVTGSSDRTIRLWNLENGKEERILKEHKDEITGVVFTPDNRSLISAGLDGSVRLWEINSSDSSRKIITDLPEIQTIAVSRDGVWLAAAAENEIKIWDLSQNRLVSTLKGHTDKIYALSFNPKNQNLASADADNIIKFWRVENGEEINSLAGHTGVIHALSYNQDGKWLASGSEDGSMIIWNGANGKPAATLVSMRTDAGWLIITPEGLFDGSSAAWSQILWRFGSDTFNAQPVEIFFNEFFFPGLLAEILSGNSLTLPNGKDISKVDRRQPKVKILSIEGQPPSANAVFDKRAIKVQIEITENSAKPQQKELPENSGAKDLRLFRNGSLVKVWHGDVFSENINNGCRQMPEESAKPKRVVCDVNVPIVAGQNEFSAYAFNHNNVKSIDAVSSAGGADNLKRKGNLYILAVGINRYEDTSYNLNFAVADASELSEELKKHQDNLGFYNEPKIIALFDKEATKQNILYAFSRFSNEISDENIKTYSPSTPEIAEKFEQIKPSQPEDAILLYFAGHGFASQNHFYLIPHNMNGGDGANRLQKLRSNSISDEELEKILEFIDAGKILFVIDACNSGQILEAEEKRRGPMNSKGLAQLAYEKGMYILTAAQSYQAALEISRTPTGKTIEHGLLTYSLLESLNTPKADADLNKQITEREWFDYAVREVPQMQLEEMKKRQVEIKEGKSRSKLVIVAGDENKNPENRALQTPRVFYRGETVKNPLIIAKP